MATKISGRTSLGTRILISSGDASAARQRLVDVAYALSDDCGCAAIIAWPANRFNDRCLGTARMVAAQLPQVDKAGRRHDTTP